MLAGLSQERLGIEAGIDPSTASARMSRYELARRVPDPALVERLGDVLGVPAAYFYAEEEDVATLLLRFHQLDAGGRARVSAFLDELEQV